MADRTPLERLAERHGVALDYYDIWGKQHHAAPGSLAAILGAMGVPAVDDGTAEAFLADAEAARWHRLLPPVMVVRADRLPPRVRLNLPTALDGSTLAWRLREESGAEHRGEFVPGALPLLESGTGAGEHFAARELAPPVAPPLGYHRLEIAQAGVLLAAMPIIVVPRTCYAPAALAGGEGVWGLAVQLYAVRSARNWGIGDLTDLRGLVELGAARGAAFVGVNPLHALFPHNPAHASPYSPSSRLFVNALYLDVEAVEDCRECEEVRAHVGSATFQQRLAALRDAALVDYPGVAAAKFEALEGLFAHFRRLHLAQDTSRARAFRAFQAREGEALRRHALFESLQAHFHRADPSVGGWQRWPMPYRDPAAAEVARFAAAHGERVAFHEYLQWQADLQLAAVGRRSLELGLGVGLYQDLAVSADRAGAEVWADQTLHAAGAGVGCPPDDFNLSGQDWGLPPLVPEQLRATGYAPFVAMLRANMRHAGALRIDHVMGLMRLFWVPPGGKAKDGAYVRYPFADLLGVLLLESERNRCLVVGEDLGTVPDEVRAALGEAGVLSYRLLYFERDGAGEFKPPADYPAQAIVAASTHDLPPLAGWWSGADLALRESLDLYPSAAVRDAQGAARAQDRARLLRALEREALLPPGTPADPAALVELTPELGGAVQLYLARTPARLLAVQLEDVLGVASQVNLPGTIDEHPNWRRKLPLSLERCADDERVIALGAALAPLRGSPRR